MDGRPILEIRELTHIYSVGTAFEKKALDAVSLKIFKGERIGLIGHTGSGKSTLIQHFNALLKPSSGQVLLDGSDINSDKKSLKRVRERVGLVFQYPEHQLFEETVYKDISFGPKNMGLTQDEIDERTLDAAGKAGLPAETLEKSPFELSGGQKRRAAIAGVISMRPDVLVLDEPTAGLDPSGRDEILSQIKILGEASNQTLVLVSHSMEDVANFAGRVVVMAEGRIVCDGTPEHVFSQTEMLASLGLAVPQAALIMQGLRGAGYDAGGAHTVGQAVSALLDMHKSGSSKA
ncbi:MAG: energy-coupling factor transporter ATPase [Defluviitaleaceae bacterium]|nr:energy-coupling factor transporter ATPase [Defluviitaleaceae bacterium]